jgi:hypothetical protein
MGDLKVLEVFVVSPDLYGMVSTFKVMFLVFQSSDDGKHLSVVDLVIFLHRIQRFGQEGNEVPGIILVRLLGENCSSSDARAIGSKSKWEIVIREHQNWGQMLGFS